MIRLLSLFRRRPVSPRVEPVDPPAAVLEAIEVEAAQHQLVIDALCRERDRHWREALADEVDEAVHAAGDVLVPVPAVPAGYSMPVPATEFGVTAGQVVAAEGRVLGRLACETARAGSTPWDAAVRVFGGAAVACDAPGERLSGPLADRQRENVHR